MMHTTTPTLTIKLSCSLSDQILHTYVNMALHTLNNAQAVTFWKLYVKHSTSVTSA